MADLIAAVLSVFVPTFISALSMLFIWGVYKSLVKF